VMCAMRRQQIIHEYTIPKHGTKKQPYLPSVPFYTAQTVQRTQLARMVYCTA
jgi:hypothetical protein